MCLKVDDGSPILLARRSGPPPATPQRQLQRRGGGSSSLATAEGGHGEKEVDDGKCDTRDRMSKGKAQPHRSQEGRLSPSPHPPSTLSPLRTLSTPRCKLTMQLLVPVPVPAPPESGATAPRPQDPRVPFPNTCKKPKVRRCCMLPPDDGVRTASRARLWRAIARFEWSICGTRGDEKIFDVGVQLRGRDLGGRSSKGWLQAGFRAFVAGDGRI